MKKLICGCAVSEEGDSLVQVGAVGIGHKLEQCERCKPPPATASHYSASIGAWIRFTESGMCEYLAGSKWIAIRSTPQGLVPKLGSVVRD